MQNFGHCLDCDKTTYEGNELRKSEENRGTEVKFYEEIKSKNFINKESLHKEK